MSLVSVIRRETEVIREVDSRGLQSILISVMSEIGELAEEVEIAVGRSYKKSGEGVVPESLDAIIGLIYLIDTMKILTEEQLEEIAIKKIAKWKNSLNIEE